MRSLAAVLVVGMLSLSVVPAAAAPRDGVRAAAERAKLRPLQQRTARVAPLRMSVVAPKAGAILGGARAGRPIVTHGNPFRSLARPVLGPKVAVLGGAVDEASLEVGLKNRLVQLGREVARSGGVVVTGACPGIPHVVARAAYEAGGQTVGISPAASFSDHAERFKMPIDSLSVIQMTSVGDGMGFIEREAPLVQAADILVFAGGRSGTLGELAAGMHEAKVIALLEESGGVAGQARAKILPHIGSGRAVIVADADPTRLLDKARRALATLERQRPASALLARAPRLGAASLRALPPMLPTVTFRKGGGVYAFLGSSDGLSVEDHASVDLLVDELARSDRRGHLIAPARGGLTADVARRARARGLATVGVSPAGSALGHVGLGLESAAFDTIQLTGKGPGAGEFAAGRQVIEPADIVFVAGGDHKTLGSFVFATYHPTVIAVLETAGMSGKLRTEITATYDKKPHAVVLYDVDPVALTRRAQAASATLRAEQRGQYLAAE